MNDMLVTGFIKAEVDVDLTVSRTVGVWLVDCYDDESFYVIVGHCNERGAARAYETHRKALGHPAALFYRLFPLLSDQPIVAEQLKDDDDKPWSAFNDAWIEVHL